MWDSAIGMMNDCQEKPSRIQIFLSVLLSLNSFIKAKNLISKYNIKIAVLGHSVYQHRSFLACLRKNKIKILSHAVFNLHWQKFYDSSWNIIDKKLFISLILLCNPTSIYACLPAAKFSKSNNDHFIASPDDA